MPIKPQDSFIAKMICKIYNKYHGSEIITSEKKQGSKTSFLLDGNEVFSVSILDLIDTITVTIFSDELDPEDIMEIARGLESHFGKSLDIAIY